MSGRDYIAWSLLTAGALTALGLAVSRIVRFLHWSELLHARQRQRMQRRLEVSLARVPSRYFESPASIEREIAAHDAAAMPTVRRFPRAHNAFIVFAAIWSGFIVVSLFGHRVLGLAPPEMPDNINWVWMPVVGAYNVLESLEPTAENPASSRIFGIAFLVMGTLSGIMALARAA